MIPNEYTAAVHFVSRECTAAIVTFSARKLQEVFGIGSKKTPVEWGVGLIREISKRRFVISVLRKDDLLLTVHYTDEDLAERAVMKLMLELGIHPEYGDA